MIGESVGRSQQCGKLKSSPGAHVGVSFGDDPGAGLGTRLRLLLADGLGHGVESLAERFRW